MRRGIGTFTLPTDTVLDTSGLTVSPAAPLSDAMTSAALDNLPLFGIQPVNMIDYVDTTKVATSPVTWMLLAAGGIFLLAVLLPGGRR
jgi:hypothetical protein